MTLPGREPDVDALRTDRYLDSLLAAADRHAHDVPADAAIDQPLRRTAARLRRDLVRVHPSFRFEERLAARLSSEAARTQLATAAGAEGSIASIPVIVDEEPADEEGFRPLLIGGALTSAALSIAGAAYVAWRRARPSRPGRTARTSRQRDRDRSTASRAR